MKKKKNHQEKKKLLPNISEIKFPKIDGRRGPKKFLEELFRFSKSVLIVKKMTYVRNLSRRLIGKHQTSPLRDGAKNKNRQCWDIELEGRRKRIVF